MILSCPYGEAADHGDRRDTVTRTLLQWSRQCCWLCCDSCDSMAGMCLATFNQIIISDLLQYLKEPKMVIFKFK